MSSSKSTATLNYLIMIRTKYNTDSDLGGTLPNTETPPTGAYKKKSLAFNASTYLAYA